MPACPEPGFVRVFGCDDHCQLTTDSNECRPLTRPAEIELAMTLEYDALLGRTSNVLYGANPDHDLPEKSVALVPRLTGAHKARYPRFSPDGRWLSYLVDDETEGAMGLHLLDLTEGGADRRLVTAISSEQQVSEAVVWLPDNSALVFTGTLEMPGVSCLFWQRFAGNAPHNEPLEVVRISPADEYTRWFSLASHGRAIAYLAGTRLLVSRLDPATGAVDSTALTAEQVGGGTDDVFPPDGFVWSAAGDVLALRLQSGLLAVTSVTTEAPGVPMLGAPIALGTAAQRATWAPAGRTIAFASAGSLSVAVLGAALDPTVSSSATPSGTPVHLEWSPDGRWLFLALDPLTGSDEASRLLAYPVLEASDGSLGRRLGNAVDLSYPLAARFRSLAVSHDSTRVVLTVVPDGCRDADCGDGICAIDAGESAMVCSQDCGNTCGDGRCDYGPSVPDDEFDPAGHRVCPADCNGFGGVPVASCHAPLQSLLWDLRAPATTALRLWATGTDRLFWSPGDDFIAYGLDGVAMVVSTADPSLTPRKLHLAGSYRDGLIWRPRSDPRP